MRTTLCLLFTGLLALPVLRGSDGAGADRAGPQAGPPEGPEVCATGCSALPDAVFEIAGTDYERLVVAWHGEPLDGSSPAFEELLFHGDATAARLAAGEGFWLDPTRRSLLERELTRRTARLEVRMVNEEGVERLRLDPTPVPLGVKQHLHPEHTLDLQPPEISGTVRRVGVEHLWTRL